MKDIKTIEIYWDDLTESKQNEILEAIGDNGNYDVFPSLSRQLRTPCPL